MIWWIYNNIYNIMNMCIYCVYFGSTFNYTFESRDFSREIHGDFMDVTWFYELMAKFLKELNILLRLYGYNSVTIWL